MSAERIITADELRDVAFVTLDTRAVAALARAINTIKALTAEVERLTPPERPDGLPADAVWVDWHGGGWMVVDGDSVPEAWGWWDGVGWVVASRYHGSCPVLCRPPAKPRTERVPLWEAVGRRVPGGWEITGWVWDSTSATGHVTTTGGDILLSSDEPKAVVLAEDGES